ncbi:MAG: GGDEF domain-containing protein [Oscillospiraceae bacterium]|nr:GGDEF domain-containing protein [Oscillospiraceae bacterium]
MNSKNGNSEKVHRSKIYLMLTNTGITLMVILTISLLILNKTDETLKMKVSSIADTLNVQMKMNMESYLKRMETTGTLIFSTEEVYQYDATDKNNDEYEALQTELIISDKLFDICIMENYVDFGIVYRNNHFVGKVSNGTVKLFGDKLFDDLSSMITRHRTSDGWYTGYNDDYKRIYYVKKVNENAVFVASFYSTELENVFEHPGGIGDMTVQLIENNYAIIYSSDEEHNVPGSMLPDAIYSRVLNENSVTKIDNQYLISISECGDNWFVVCSIPTRIILTEKNDIIYLVILAGTIALLLAIFINLILLDKIINPVSNIVTRLDNKAKTDLLTGVLNKRSFEDLTEDALRNCDKNHLGAIILIDVDNFKHVNDTLGHAYGDKVLSGIGDMLRNTFSAEDYLGRLGGDEFCVFIKIPDFFNNNYEAFISEKCEELCKAFRNNYTGDDNSYKISASLGAACSVYHGHTFAELYKCADTALYNSKHKGKDTFTIFDPSQKGAD